MVAVLAQFVDTVPQPLTDALVHLAPLLNVAARIAQLVVWADDWYASWVALAAWWFLCLAAPTLFRYAFPLLAALLLVLTARRRPPPLVTETVLQSAIADLTTIRNALPPVPSIQLAPFAIFRAATILLFPWLIITFWIPTRLLITILGTLIFTYKAPWAHVLRSVLWRSAFVRTFLDRIYSLLTDQPLPKYVVSNQPTATSTTPVDSLRFLFTVYENQRWWMGLDWTAALLPAERPSWCSPSLHPVSPPNAFSLPDTTTVYLPSPDGKSRIMRTAIWKWEEPEWRLVVRKEGSSVSRIERAPPSQDDPSSPSPSTSTSSGSRLFKAAANKLKESSLSSPRNSISTPDPDKLSVDNGDQDDFGEPFTDPDGWIYGDNKWESQAPRGGLSKYTRFRRWTRVAVVSETVQVVGLGELGIQNANNTPSLKSSNLPIKTSLDSIESTTTSSSSPTLLQHTNIEPESPLRQRLRAVLSK